MYIGLPSDQAQMVTPVLNPNSRTTWLAFLSASVEPIWILKSRPSLVVTKHQLLASATFTGVFVNCTRLVIHYSLQLPGLNLIHLILLANSLEHHHQASSVHTETRVMVVTLTVQFALLILHLKIRHNLQASTMSGNPNK